MTRIWTVDYEGSALRGYPIEVGVAAWELGSSVIRTWSALIRPTEDWMDDLCGWDPAAYAVHGIGQYELVTTGRPVGEIASRLDELLGGGVAHADGGEIDEGFNKRLHEAAGVRPAWRLGSMGDMVRAAGLRPAEARSFLAAVFREDADVSHRAGPDAVRLLRELASLTVADLTVLPFD